MVVVVVVILVVVVVIVVVIVTILMIDAISSSHISCGCPVFNSLYSLCFEWSET